MVINSEEHRAFLLEIFKQVQFPGHLLDLAYEVKREILGAVIRGGDNSHADIDESREVG